MPALLLVALLSGNPPADPPADRSHWPNPTHPQPVDWTTLSESVIDHSHYLHAPAGRDGHVRARNGRIETPTGRRVRWWGMNVTGATCTPKREDADFLADVFARLGINRVRFHHLDANWGEIFPDGDTTRTLDPAALDRLGYFVAALKAKGVYSNLNLHVGREFRAGDGVKDHKALGYAKGPALFDPRLIELQKEYARQLLTWENPHTGLTFAADPAVCTVEILNENSLLESWAGGRLSAELAESEGGGGRTWGSVPASYVADLHRLYGEWADATLPPEELKALRAAAGAATGPIPLTTVAEQATGDRRRVMTDARFLEHFETRFFKEMRRYLREELGVGALLVGPADHNDSLPMYAHVRAQVNAGLDVIHGHGYWQHPDLGPPTVVGNDPMVNDPADSTVAQFARTPVEGAPFVISETNHPYPHVFRAEGMPILTAYALLHDWDGIDWFEWGPPDRGGPEAPAARDRGWFRLGLDPVKVAQLMVLAPVWHRQDIAPADLTFIRHVGQEEAWAMYHGGDIAERRPYFEDGFDTGLSLEGRTVVRFSDEADGTWPTRKVPDLFGSWSRDALTWIGSPRSIWGDDTDIPEVGSVQTSSPRTIIQVARSGKEDSFTAGVSTSLSARPLKGTTHILTCRASGSTSRGLKFAPDGRTVAVWGEGPALVGAIAPRVGEGETAIPLSPIGVPTDGGPGTLLWKVERQP